MRLSSFENTQSASKQQGFTLIELVVVIVILGILAVTAAPKFIDLTSDARESVMQGVKGSINSAVSMANAKALISDQTGSTGVIKIGSIYYALVHGYPAAKSLTTGTGLDASKAKGIAGLIELDADITVTDAATTLFQHSGAADVTTCQLSYDDADDNVTRPEITEALTAC